MLKTEERERTLYYTDRNQIASHFTKLPLVLTTAHPFISFVFLAEFCPSPIALVVSPVAVSFHFFGFSSYGCSEQNAFRPTVEAGGFLVALGDCLLVVVRSLEDENPGISPSEISDVTAAQFFGNFVTRLAFQAHGSFILMVQ